MDCVTGGARGGSGGDKWYGMEMRAETKGESERKSSRAEERMADQHYTFPGMAAEKLPVRESCFSRLAGDIL